MGWTKIRSGKPLRPHVCDKPHYATANEYAGDIIQCDCGQVWKCVSIDHGYPDTTEPPVMNWEKETVIGKCNDR